MKLVMHVVLTRALALLESNGKVEYAPDFMSEDGIWWELDDGSLLGNTYDGWVIEDETWEEDEEDDDGGVL